MKSNSLVAVNGKGGTGKTVFTAIMTKILTEENDSKILVIDADPAMGLRSALGIEVDKTIKQIREDIIESARDDSEEKEEVARKLDYEIFDALGEGEGFGLLVLGLQETPGCFCPANALLKRTIESLSEGFDIILIDCEAGLEQLNREVISTVGTIVAVTDLTMRGAETAATIEESAKKFTEAERIGLVVNRVDEGEEGFARKIANRSGLEMLGVIPEDENITEWDRVGKPIIELPEDSPSVEAVQQIADEIL